MKDLEQFLVDRAMEHDSPTLLFGLACEYLVSAKTIRPGVVTLAKMVAAVRMAATALTWELVAELVTDQVREDLDRLLKVPPAGIGTTRLKWLTTAVTDAGASAVKSAIEKLVYLRSMDVHRLDLSMLPTERRRFLAGVGRRSTNQALERRELERRYPILPVLADPSIQDEEVGSILRSSIGMSRLREVASGGLEAASPRSRPVVGDECLLLLPAAVHPGGAEGDRLSRRAGHGGADGGSGDPQGVEPVRRA
ncbi:DUF4158 domain-containing protein [Nonomuraea sp. NPDC050394]|uniref:DUF4158 domain-containing protein n=1 Tax=Nonomuraea sp. NPDC050394 TaxID=3364363 RepID=UPI00378D701B